MPDELQESSESAEASPTQSDTDPQKLQAELTKALQKTANLQRVLRDSDADFQLGQALRNHPEGAPVIEALAAGKPLTKDQQRVAAEAAPTNGVSAENNAQVIKDGIAEGIQQIREALRNDNEVEREVGLMHTTLSKELPGYEAIHDTQEWAARFNNVLNLYRGNALNPPEPLSGRALYEWLGRQTYSALVMENPDLGKKKPVSKTDAERASEAARGGSPATSVTPATGDGLPEGATEKQKRDYALARERPPTSVGVSYGTRRSS